MRKKQEEVRRFVRFEYDDGSYKEFEIGKASVLRKDTDQILAHIDRLKDGRHLLLLTQEVLPEGRRLDAIRIVRPEEGLDDNAKKENKDE